MKVIISPLNAVSTINQANLVRKLLEEKGYESELKGTITIPMIQDSRNYAFLWLTLASPLFLTDAVAPYLFTKKPRAVYVTLEGIPTKAMVNASNIPRLEFIAVSNFVKDCLRKLDLKVKDVVHHAIDYKLCSDIAKRSKMLKEQFKEKYGDKCLILYNGRHDPRKKVDRLIRAIKYLQVKGRDDFVLLMITEKSVENILEMEKLKKNVDIIAHFGTIPYHRVLELISACDYLVFPSVAEGFGLPLLEANALGVPVIHCWFPPLSEFSSQDFNFTWNYTDEILVNNPPSQYWIFHEYPIEALVDGIEFAVDTYNDNKEEYNEYCIKARKHAKSWDYRKIYPKLLKYLGID